MTLLSSVPGDDCEALDRLLTLADRPDAAITDSWGGTAVRVGTEIDIAAVLELARSDRFTVTAFFGDSYLPLVLGAHPPDPNDVSAVARLAPNERIETEVRSASTSLEVAALLGEQTVELEVRFERPAWIRNGTALVTEIDRHWAVVADSLRAGLVQVGDIELELRLVAPPTAANRPHTLEPVGTPPEGPAGDIWGLFVRLADAAAWVNLAAVLDRTNDGVRIGLIPEDAPRRLVTPDNSEGGRELFRWATATEDANRQEALRYVMSLVAAAATEVLPSATTLRQLAERQRIALSRERAAEVQRAIADAQRDAAEALRKASADLGELVEDTTKSANASILAVLGLVAFLAREANRLPDWLVIAAALVAIAGIALVVASRWSRIRDQEAAVRQLRDRLRGDPLLPVGDREAAEAMINDFGLDQRATRARQYVAAVGGGASATLIAAAAWLVWTTPEVPTPQTPTQAPTSTPAASAPTSGSSASSTTSHTSSLPGTSRP